MNLFLKEIELTTGRGGHSANVPRMSVVERGRYIRLYPGQRIEDQMKSDDVEMVRAVAVFDDDGKLVGILIKKAEGSGIKVRYTNDDRHDRTHIPVPTKNIGKAVVTNGKTNDVCEVEVTGDGYLFKIRDGITFERGGGSDV